MDKRRGFTLIELLVVIAIISLLMAMLVPALERVRKQARKIVCQANLHQWGIVWKMFVDDNGGMFTEMQDFISPLAPYYSEDVKIVLCPMAPLPRRSIAYGGDLVRGSKYYAYEIDHPIWRRRMAGSYGYNAFLTRDYGNVRSPATCWSTPNVKANYMIPVLADCTAPNRSPMHNDQPPRYDGDDYMKTPMNVNELKSFVIDRHDQQINAVFANWSVRPAGLKELWELKWSRNWYRGDRNPPTDWDNPNHWMNPMKDYVR